MVPLSPFHMFQLMDFHPGVTPALLSHPSVCFHGLNHMLHKCELGISAENIIKMSDITDAGQKAEKKAPLLNCLLPLVIQNIRCDLWGK